MSVSRKVLAVLLSLSSMVSVACSAGQPAAPDAKQPPASAPTTTNSGDPESKRVVDEFVERANAGDEEGVTATFAEDARFDSAGRIFHPRDDIMLRFLLPDVLRAGGKYHPGAEEWQDGRLVVHYRYQTGSGGTEAFTYSYLVRDGLIRDVVGRYE